LKILGYTEWLGFLENARKGGQKLDDFCDSFLLALQAAIEMQAIFNKNKLPANIPKVLIQKPNTNLPVAISFPEIEVEGMPEKKKRKTPVKRAPAKKKKADDADANAIDNEVAIKRRKQNLSFRDEDEHAMIIKNLPPPSPTKKRKESPVKKSKYGSYESNKKLRMTPLSIEIVDDGDDS
jgi:hypothetical protein